MSFFRASSQLREEPVSLRSTCFDRRDLYHQHHLGSPSKEPGIGKTVLKAWPYQIWEISVRLMGFSGGTRGKKPAWQWRICKRQGFHPLVWKIPSWQPIPVFLHGESHGQRSLAGCSLQGFTESDTTEATSLSLFTFMYWRRKWQPTPAFLPGESHGWGSLVGCRL